MTPPPYFLTSPRLGFRHWTEADLEIAMELWGDANVTRLIGGPFTRQQVSERLAIEIRTQDSRGVQYWPMFLLSSGEHVGCCGLRPYPPSPKIFELGFHILQRHWGCGFATESARTIMEFAFMKIGVTSLFAGHHPENDVSRRLLRKLGFQYSHDELYPATGLRHPSYLLLAEHYHSSTPQK
ncbi:MAG: hypothetical protein A2X67_13835 [Ignavibacteria bacterium GWA2_55_11]|nr:MAG: hypothetical protein A2X67_13835 [Ignavibacteria bacterium GWA2_55_11]OGU45552.1 MAG: hypothetical protein A2X68_06975 [Ignavibacteria bacterium GWC2_56_12]OGU64364.1 MAG: hypothetical protein A3C56_09750 [Ignavibacteria bacterium RIFCSPHIGHO2_02_FULL_56_12]OGU70807.1 MAG: hypothetical protein A3H45_03365 [Ignavibacteria bacterium RIFCSPLOWO2_02_FULL_55_14]OGU75668.1 MAG: hypothetical protein A3G43_13915 [Ignavibacteria bacterium RIFCSPLOWO2_12_FULL_56_21]HAV24482.1 GNAT family N-acety